MERFPSMDVLRGFALLGILLVNIQFFWGPFMATSVSPWRELADPWLLRAVTFLVQGKFYALFSFLFGAGFAVQAERLEDRGVAPARIYRRRLGVLLAFGLAHGILLWMGDILAVYALLGFVLLAFRKRQPRTLLIWAFSLLAAGTLLVLAGWLFLTWAGSLPRAAPELAKAKAEEQVRTAQAMAASLQAYGHGPYVLLFKQRLKELLHNYAMTLGVLPQILALFLLGAWTARRGVFRAPEAHTSLLRNVQVWGLVWGLAGNGFFAWAMDKGMPGPGKSVALLGFAAYFTAAPALTLAYAASLILALRRPALGALLRPLAAPGRMALSNYLGHSVVMTTIFYFYGGGLYGKLPLLAGYGLALGLYALLLWGSGLWLQRFAMGPAEWLWRGLTYGHAPPFRRDSTSP
jgi:uncharacterized protein